MQVRLSPLATVLQHPPRGIVMTRKNVFARLALVFFVVLGVSIAAFGGSHVRIVRLSSVEGQVQMDRGTGGGLERAILNTPIVEGTRLVTGSDGLAEVEFENESALRLTGDSEIRFSQLLLTDTGTKVNQFQVVKGTMYLDAASKGDDIYRIKVGDASLLAHRDTLMRVDATGDQLKVAVFKGDVQLEGAAQPVSIRKKETLTINLNDATKYQVASGVESSRFDAWNKERQEYAKTYADNTGYGGPNRGYGMQDLNYYGDFVYASGYGYVWQPYGFAGSMLNWSPYSNGAWLFYPGLGYSWASAYPWGWLPFHYGSWAFINGAGWAWLPGAGYNGTWYAGSFQAVPRVTRAPAGWSAPTPPGIPASSAPRTVEVGTVNASSLTIPGGRIQPNFGSLVPGRTIAATQGFARPTAGANANHAVFAAHSSAPTAGYQGHVFAVPARSVGGLTPAEAGGIRGGASGWAGAASHGSASSSSASHGSASAGHK